MLDLDRSLRQQLLAALKGGQAHTTFEHAIADFPFEQTGVRPPGQPHSAWELLEHLRIAQEDIVRFSQSAGHQSPKWPEGYWPAHQAPADEAEWNRSIAAFQADLDEFCHLVEDEKQDVHAPFPWGEGQNLLREALLIVDHNAYHLGELVLVRRTLGIWE